ncbi:hypothetical protein TPHA_0K00280 [Tetrapisispora phaffii CBS 4417]|uniref:HECT-type E3 ubiquitin transferase n=1 Tax=Tetrapisispora phaffii (strain ATCC 24235 / CBS 4417 / NBRC 1672 / NRRL Y-8282 / UCD 70-5) TaxID=1071381 RepID=G8BZ34_TETPH|nr:hypothetical protein TPHA_0K00280 [Tetrapisispora phaffii CBS 4417]CCE65162.1 hypothetical protein TPHA_0K00280 [Tetrapisispora phaffii CBS 4417]
MVKLTNFETLQKKENAKAYKPLIDGLINCTLDEFVSKLNDIQDWDRSRDDLFVWIPVLDRIDELLSNIVKKYGYESADYIKNPPKLTVMKKEDESVCISLIEFTQRLLYNTENRFFYSSMDVMNNLLNCPNFEIKLVAIKVLAIMGERYVIARERIDSKNILSTHLLKKKALELALALPSSTIDDDNKHFSLVGLYFDDKKFPAKWSKLKFTYYTSSNQKLGSLPSSAPPSTTHHFPNHSHNKDLTPTTNSTSLNASFNNPSIKKLVIQKDELASSTLQHLLNKGMELLSKEHWFDFSLKVSIAKSFSNDSPENLELRNLIVRTKFNAMALVNTIYIPPQVSSKLFEIDPYAFNSLTDFISLSETKVPKALRADALFALECISLKHVWCSDIVRNLGGNMSHGLLFQILHYISKALREKNAEVDEDYNVRFFYLISNLADVKTLHSSLIAAGLIPSLIDIVSIKHSTYRRTTSSANHLLELLIDDAESTSEFINNDGLNILINSIRDEVTFALENPDYGKPPTYSTVYYSVSFRQLAYIRSLLKIVQKMLKSDSGDRIRNLIDSPILVSLLDILKNRSVFGYTLVTHSLDIIQIVLNSEPTIYNILVEAGIIPFIFDHFEEFICPYPELIALLPELLSALCLNPDGLNKVKNSNMIQLLTEAVTNINYAKLLSWKQEASQLGTSLDELTRHYPELKPIMVKSFTNVVTELLKKIDFNQPFLYKSSLSDGYYFNSTTEEVNSDPDGSEELAFWDVQKSTSLVDCFADLLYGMTMENATLNSLSEQLDFSKVLEIIIMKHPPFDYVSSQTMLNFTDVLQLLEEKKKGFAFPILLKMLDTQLQSISEFLNSSMATSFILNCEGNDSSNNVEEILGKLSRVTALLYVITDVYISVTSLSPSRVTQIMEYFEKNGFQLITNLRLLFQKCAIEDEYIRNHMPVDAIRQTMPEFYGNAPPIQIHDTKPSEEETKNDFKSAKMKNSYQTRFLLTKLQTCSSIVFRCLLRLTHSKNAVMETSNRALELRVFEVSVKEIIEMLRYVPVENHLQYFLVVLNFNSFVFSFPKTSIMGNGILQTIPIQLFIQDGGFQIYIEFIKKLFNNLINFKNIADIEDIPYLKNTTEVLTLSCLLNILIFMNKSIETETLENVRSIGMYYPNQLPENDYNITDSVIQQVRILALGLIHDLKEEGLLFDSIDRKIPYSVFKQILSMLQNTFYESSAKDLATPLKLDWKLVPPSNAKAQLLIESGLAEDIAVGYLEQNKDELPKDMKPDCFSNDEWTKYKTLKKENIYEPVKIIPCYGSIQSYNDFFNMKNAFVKKELPQKLFETLPIYPKLVNAFAKTLLLIYSSHSESSKTQFMNSVLDKIIETDNNNSSLLSPLTHLYGIFMNEKSVYKQSFQTITRFLNHLQIIINPKFVNSLWFSKALYVYEIILAKSNTPAMIALPDNIPLVDDLPASEECYAVDDETKETIFNILIRMKELNNFYSALAIARILILYASQEVYSKEIINSGILPEILKAIGVNQKSEKINFLESSFILLLRRCFEVEEVVTELIKFEINKSFTSRTFGEHKLKERELNSLIEEKPYTVMRDPTKFINTLSASASFIDFAEDGSLTTLLMEKKSADSADVAVKNNTDSNYKRTGIIHFLLSQLMAASKKDWISEPVSTKSLSDKKNGSEKIDPTKNPVCAYMIFLLKALVELVGSYKQCKFEFLTFDRRNTYAEFAKPRFTALNFFLYQLLDKSSNSEQDKYELKRREVISTLARSVLVAFISSVQDSSIKAQDPKVIEYDMTFVRKCSIEAIIKALRNSSSTPKSLEANFNKIEGWLKIISSMIFVQAPYLRLILDANKIDADQYQMCKLMIEMDVPNVISECLSVLDINYPFAKKMFNNAIDPLNALNSVRNSFSELFKIEGLDDEDEEDMDSDKEEQHNMFKNSSLGMYDVEDIEEDDEDDESLIGDDEEIAFVNAEDGGYDVVFSEDEDTGSVTSNTSEDIHSSDSENEIDYSLDSADGLTVDVVSDSSYNSSEIADDVDSDAAMPDDDSGVFYNNGSDIELISIDSDVFVSDADMDLDLSDYDIDQSDWESGLSDFPSTDDEAEEVTSIAGSLSRGDNSRRRWLTSDGVEILDNSSDEEDRPGVFQGIEHVFEPDEEHFFRVQDMHRSHRNPRSLHRSLGNSPLVPPSLSLLNIGRRNQNSLINPLGPAGLEEVENDVSEQLLNIVSGQRPRTERPTFASLLFSGDSLDDKAPDGILLKPTLARWKDIFDMFYNTKGYAKNTITSIIAKMYPPSYKLFKEKQEKLKDIEKLPIKKLEENSSNPSNEEIPSEPIEEDEYNESDESPAVTDEEDEGISDGDEIITEGDEAIENREPIYVTIDGESIDISGTDIDPEFLNALPEDMRAEVFSQHIRERRAEAAHNHIESREIDSDFLNAIPEEIREDILEHETVDSRVSNIMRTINDNLRTNMRQNGRDSIDSIEVIDERVDLNTTENEKDADSEKKKSSRIYFSPLVDRAGISALMKSIFISQPYIQREMYHELFYRLCSSKQNRSDIINFLLLILTEGIQDQHSLERVYSIMVNLTQSGPNKYHNNSSQIRQLPPDSTPLVVANQAIEILQNLIDADNRLKYFFITEHENLLVGKSPIKNKKDINSRASKYPLQYLFTLLDKKLITDETVLMDLLTKILQTCTKPLHLFLKSQDNKSLSKMKFNMPEFTDDMLIKIVSIINIESCNTRVFQQLLATMHNLSGLENSLNIFDEALVNLAKSNVIELIQNLKDLQSSQDEIANGNEINSELLQKFTLPSSCQSKILKILTALDYLHTHKKEKNCININNLMSIYNRMNLGKLWSALSCCLTELEDKKGLSTSATILLPLIESLMVVNKHNSLLQDSNKPGVLKYESIKSLDLEQVPTESIFFPFTDLHKKLLNQMIRTNPKLMSGPFSLLIKNSKVLDFDNKRYYFVAKLRSDFQDHPKLSITVSRDQVFLDSYRALFFKPDEEIKKSKLEITFKGESGVDAGGLTREWYQVLSRQMFNPDYALFIPVASDKTTFRPNRTSGINPEHHSFFKFIGMIIGKAIRDQCYLDCHFSREVYKNILGKPVTLKDMESLDLDYYKSLNWILENDITDIIEETFSVETDDYGEHKIIDLIDDGRNIAVTNLNKQDYVQKIVQYKLKTSVNDQMDNFLKGFYALIPKELISIFNEQELELLISGLPDIDVNDWQSNTTYVNYTSTSKQINYFWRAVKSFDTEERVKLLQFVTGTSKVPLNGFKELAGVNGLCKFSIHKDYGPSDRLPSSHTCFNQLDLPAYDSYETLRGSLLLAITEGYEGFGIA